MCGATIAAHAQTFHVAPGGDDANPGTAIKPWATLQHAAERVVAGDTVYVHEGQYRGFELRRRGKPGAPIEIRASNAVVTDDNPNTPDGIAVRGAAYVTISGFTVRGASRTGVRVEQSQHVELRDLAIDGAGVGGIAALASDDVTIEGARVVGAQRSHGISISGGARPHIERSLVSKSGRDGIAIDGAQRDGGSGVVDDARLVGNRIWDNGGVGVTLDGAPRAVVASTAIWANPGGGVVVKRESGGGPSVGVQLVNDTIVAPDGAWAVRLRDGATDAVVRDDILVSADPQKGALDACVSCLPFTSDRNAVTPRFSLDGGAVIDLSGWRVQTKHDTASFAADASLFVDAMSENYALAPGSAAIDRGGDARGIDVDVLGHRRVVGARADLGAFEWCAGDACTPRAPGALEGRGPRGGCCDGGGAGSALAGLFGAPLVFRRRKHVRL